MNDSIEKVIIVTESIHLDQLMKWVGLTETGGQARILIDDGFILVNGIPVKERRKQIRHGDVLNVNGQDYLIVREETLLNAR